MEKISYLQSIKSKSFSGGGKDKIQMQHNLGKMTARERIIFLLDEGSFIELGGLINTNGAGVITGYGTIDSRLVYVYSQDYTVEGGTINKVNSKKITDIMEMAVEMGAPTIQIFDSIGANLEGGVENLHSYGSILSRNAKLSGVVPQIAIVAGPCAGIAAISATMSDFTIIVDKIGQLYLNSVSKIEEVENKYVGYDMYAEASNCALNGNANLISNNEEEAYKLARKILGYLPSNNMDVPYAEEKLHFNSINTELNKIVSEDQYDIYEIINAIVDEDSIIEINKNWKQKIITMFVKLNGMPVGIVSNNVKFDEEGLDIKSSDKITRFIRTCDSFNIPILSIVDSQGFKASQQEEMEGQALYVSKLVYVIADSQVPKVSLIVGKAYGAGYITLASKEIGYDVVYAWPNAKISITEPTKVINILYREEIVEAEKPSEKEKELINKYTEEFINPYIAAEKGYIDDIIIPNETKQRIYATLDMLQSKRKLKYLKRHGSTLI